MALSRIYLAHSAIFAKLLPDKLLCMAARGTGWLMVGFNDGLKRWRDAGKKGGKARADRLTAEERSEIARKAVQARWARVRQEETDDEQSTEAIEPEIITPAPDMPIARWRGTLNLVGLEVPCYVLDNGLKVIG